MSNRIFQSIGSTKPVIWLALAAALLYSSWPLGPILNPSVAHQALASQLEAPHQPYDWLFISLDVLTGLCLVVAGYIQLKRPTSPLIKRCIQAYMLFGVLVAGAAIVPLRCDPELSQCGPLIHQPLILLHGTFSLLSVGLLLLSTLLTSYMAINKETERTIKGFVGAIAFCWLAFGVGSLLELSLKIKGNGMQDYFITVCSLSIILVITLLERFRTLEPAQEAAS